MVASMVVDVGRAAVMTAIPLATCILVELLAPRTRYRLRDRFPGALFILIPPIFAVIAIAPLQTLWQALGVPPLVRIADWPLGAKLLALIVLRDFFNYWQHRLDHRWLWPIHSVHHSVRELHAANGFTHPFQGFSELVYISVPLSLVDFGGYSLPVLALQIVAVQSMIIHSPLRIHLGPLRYLIVDSRFHRVHHAIDERHYNRNFGTIFTVWDVLFRTAYFPAPDEWADVGVIGLDEPDTLRDYLGLPLRQYRGAAVAATASTPTTPGPQCADTRVALAD